MQFLALEHHRPDLAEVFSAALVAKGYTPLRAEVVQMLELIAAMRANCGSLLAEGVTREVWQEGVAKLIEDAARLDSILAAKEDRDAADLAGR